MIHYSSPLYRPPAEADNIILQATLGCRHNQCTFCEMYKSKKYQVRALEELSKEINELSRGYPNTNKVFLADGDALALPTEHLAQLLRLLKNAFPKLSRVSLYATAQNFLEKSIEELIYLREEGLTLAYFGIETGNELLLKKIHKGIDANEMIEALYKAKEANIKISATVILGLGGRVHSEEHIRDTAQLLNQVNVNYLSTLQLGLQESGAGRFMGEFDSFEMLGDEAILQEQKKLLEQLNPSNKIIFRSNHASNALHLSGTLPKDSPRLIHEITAALEIGEGALVPKWSRGF